MKFEKISIRNFRNFENIEIGISNKNIFFGLNDIGKTNFLYAMRYVFDKDIRKNGFLDSDFHKKNVEIAFNTDIYQNIAITFHSSKGLEFDQVILFAGDYNLSDMSGIYNHYVAVTRAKEKVVIVKCSDYYANRFESNLSQIFALSGLKTCNLVTYK